MVLGTVKPLGTGRRYWGVITDRALLVLTAPCICGIMGPLTQPREEPRHD